MENRKVQVILQEADLHGNLATIFHFPIDRQCAIFQVVIITWQGKRLIRFFQGSCNNQRIKE
jgi:hypothetical protein